MSTFGMRLVAHDAGGERIGVLPDALEAKALFQRSEVGSLSLTYSRLARRGTVLDRPLVRGLEIAVEVGRGDIWTEPANGRFLVLKRDLDERDATRTVSLSCPSYGWLLTKVRVEALVGDNRAAYNPSSGTLTFSDTTVGKVIGYLLDGNAQRGGIPLGRSFTAAADARGKAWSKVIPEIEISVGDPLDQVLRALTEQGLVSWQTVGRTLALYDTDGLGSTRAATLLLHRDVITEAPATESLEPVAASILTKGDDGFLATLPVTGAPTPWGSWEETISQSGVKDLATAQVMAEAAVVKASRIRGQYTRALAYERATSLPLLDYAPGDWIMAPGLDVEPLRVESVTLDHDGQRVTGAVTLNDRFFDVTTRALRQIAALGARGDLGGSGAAPRSSEGSGAGSQTFIQWDQAGVNGGSRGQVPEASAIRLQSGPAGGSHLWLSGEDTGLYNEGGAGVAFDLMAGNPRATILGTPVLLGLSGPGGRKMVVADGGGILSTEPLPPAYPSAPVARGSTLIATDGMAETLFHATIATGVSSTGTDLRVQVQASTSSQQQETAIIVTLGNSGLVDSQGRIFCSAFCLNPIPAGVSVRLNWLIYPA